MSLYSGSLVHWKTIMFYQLNQLWNYITYITSPQLSTKLVLVGQECLVPFEDSNNNNFGSPVKTNEFTWIQIIYIPLIHNTIEH